MQNKFRHHPYSPNRLFLLFFSLLFFLIFLSGCTMTRRPAETSKADRTVSVAENCRFADDPFSPVWTFYLSRDNRILKMELHASLNRREIEKVYPDASEEEIQQIYLEHGKKQDEDFTYLSSRYPSKKWLTRTWKFDDQALEYDAFYQFDVSVDGFNYELESSLFKDFSLDSLWNEQKRGFYYDEKTVKSSLFGNAGVCANKEEQDYSIKDLSPQEMSDKKTENDGENDGEDTGKQSQMTNEQISELFGSGTSAEPAKQPEDSGKDDGEKDSPAENADTNKDAPSSNPSSRPSQNGTSRPNVQDVNENVSIFEQFGLSGEDDG